ncbi:hypothetical protein BJV78DRAFT_888786 [Lactifluus subvellereus]|nr:hypothetical protein BJV78DRAFT_888786 [Lactifluus subvellereus]
MYGLRVALGHPEVKVHLWFSPKPVNCTHCAVRTSLIRLLKTPVTPREGRTIDFATARPTSRPLWEASTESQLTPQNGPRLPVVCPKLSNFYFTAFDSPTSPAPALPCSYRTGRASASRARKVRATEGTVAAHDTPSRHSADLGRRNARGSKHTLRALILRPGC